MASRAEDGPPRWRTWLQLFRAPNLFTVPGDPLVGYLLATAGVGSAGLPAAIGASLCLYSAGLLTNDLADFAEDRRDRPTRPLPSGSATRGQVIMASLLLIAVGFGLLLPGGNMAVLRCGGALIAAILCYNFATKSLPVIGALNMGLCRALSVFLGACMGPAYGRGLAVPAAVLFGLYIAAVTNLARHETKPSVPVAARLWPALVVLVLALGAGAQARMSPEKRWALPVLALAAGCAVWYAIRLLRNASPFLPPFIGAYIRLLLPLQAALALVADPWEIGRWSALLLLALWPLARVVSRWFYAS